MINILVSILPSCYLRFFVFHVLISIIYNSPAILLDILLFIIIPYPILSQPSQNIYFLFSSSQNTTKNKRLPFYFTTLPSNLARLTSSVKKLRCSGLSPLQIVCTVCNIHLPKHWLVHQLLQRNLKNHRNFHIQACLTQLSDYFPLFFLANFKYIHF